MSIREQICKTIDLLQTYWFEQPITDVISEISPNDDQYEGNKDHYLSAGQSALRCIKLAMLVAGKDIRDIKNILDVPCGYGRVLRALKASFPEAHLTGCDFNWEAVEFCKRTFGATPVYADQVPSRDKFKEKFDLIWCGSLFTHLDSIYWQDFLRLFDSVLCPRGILVFTVHGRWAIRKISMGEFTYGLDETKLSGLLEDYDRSGFAYVDYRKEENYGISVSTPSYILSSLETIPTLRLLTYMEKGWDNHQDVISCSKEIVAKTSEQKKPGIHLIQLNKTDRYNANSNRIPIKPNQMYQISVNLTCKKGGLYSAYFAVIILDSNNKEIVRYIRWIRDFSGQSKHYSIAFRTLGNAVNAVLGYRVNTETPSESDFQAELPALSTIKLEQSHKLDNQFDDMKEAKNIAVKTRSVEQRRSGFPADADWLRSRMRWSQAGPNTGLTWGKTITGDPFILKIAEYQIFGPERVILELGPGYGRLLKSILSLGLPFKKYLGIDLSEKNIAYLRESFRGSQFNFLLGDFENIHLTDKFDTVISSLTLKHLYPTFESALRNIVQFVNPGGIFSFDLIEAGYPCSWFERDDITFVRQYTRGEVEQLLSKIPLNLVAFDKVMHDEDHIRLLVVARKSS